MGVETSIYELERAFADPAGQDVALAELRAYWPALVAIHGARLRAIIDSLPTPLWDTDPWLITAYASTFRSVASRSRSAAFPYFDAAFAILSDDADLGIRIGMHLHHSAALRSVGRLDEALVAAHAAAALTGADTTMPLGWRIRLRAKSALQAGIVGYHLGDYDAALSELHTAAGLADPHLFASEIVECLSALAMVEYSMGNFILALEYAQEARAAAGDSGLIDSPFGASALIAELLIAVERSRRDDAEQLIPRVLASANHSDWEPLGFYGAAAVSIISEQYVEGLDLLRKCLQSYRRWVPTGTIVTVSAGLRATLLLRLGETDTAWDILGSLTPTQHHANCPARFIAHLRFITGDAPGALAALRECEALGDRHSSRTLVDVLLLKSAANYQLGNTAIAEVAFDRGIRLAAQNDMRIPFRLVPEPVMREMLDSAAGRPQSQRVRELLDGVQGAASVGGATGGMLLTDRERGILRALMRNLSVADISEELYISVNTVKSHLKSIYRKLGVSSRAAAIKRARELGHQVDITLD